MILRFLESHLTERVAARFLPRGAVRLGETENRGRDSHSGRGGYGNYGVGTANGKLEKAARIGTSRSRSRSVCRLERSFPDRYSRWRVTFCVARKLDGRSNVPCSTCRLRRAGYWRWLSPPAHPQVVQMFARAGIHAGAPRLLESRERAHLLGCATSPASSISRPAGRPPQCQGGLLVESHALDRLDTL